jgi:aryl-alcohol dehydrogenase-like predicted oxidoreductase
MTTTTTAMPKRTGGLPALALGCMNFGKRTPARDSERIIRRALERGVRVFDTANAYNDGESERILGRALGGDRANAVVATKVGSRRIGGKPEGLSPEAMHRAIAGSLERLGTPWVDVYYLHVPDHATPLDHTLGAMHELVNGGQVREWGVSNYAAWQILDMSLLADRMGLVRPVVSQVIYNLLHRQLDIEYFRYTLEHPIHTTVFNPLAGGLLTGKHVFDVGPGKGSRFEDNALYRRRYWTRPMFERVEQLRALAHGERLTLVQLAYAWIATRPDVDSILVGPATVEQLDDAIDAVQKKVSPGALTKIDEMWREWNGTDTNYVR